MEYNTFLTSLLLIGVIILFFLLRNDIENFANKKNIISSLDGRNYKVVGSFENEKEAANTLARINKFVIKLMKHMKTKYLINQKGGYYEKDKTLLLLKRYDPDVLFENNPSSKKNTSYVLNKGDKIAFCIREKDSGNNNIHKWELIKFVVLHEISHIISKEYGHGNEFWTNFKFMINEAEDAGLYRPIDFSKTPKKYCGVDITYCPAHDIDL